MRKHAICKSGCTLVAGWRNTGQVLKAATHGLMFGGNPNNFQPLHPSQKFIYSIFITLWTLFNLYPDFIFTGNQIALIFGTNLFNFHPLQCRAYILQFTPPTKSETIFPTMGDHFISLVNLYPEFIFTTNQSDWIRLYSQPHVWWESLQLPPPTIRGKRCRAHIPSTNSDSIFTTMGDNINPY